MPGPRIEVAERLVLHLVELGKQLGDQPVWAAMVGEKIMADSVTAWSPKNLEAILTQKIASALYMWPVAQLERRVKMPVRARLDQVDRVMVHPTAKE